MISSKNQLKLGAIISYGVILFNILAGLLYTPWMVNKIGKTDYGLYILVTTFLAYFVVDYGMWQSINKLVSQFRAEGNQKKIEQTISAATKIYFFLDIGICIILLSIYIFIDSIFDNLTPDNLLKFKTIFIIAAIFSILNFPFGFVRGIMFAFEYLIINRLLELGAKILLILSTIFALLLGGGLFSLVIVYAAVPFLKNIIAVIFLYKRGIRIDLRSWNKEIVWSILGISGWLFLYVIAELFVSNISPTIISIKNSMEQVAIFAIGYTIYGYVYQISNAIAGIFLTKITKMRHLGLTKEIEEYSTKIGRIQLIISGYLILGILLTGSTFINAWMGESFFQSYYVASLMVIPGFIIYSQQIELALLYAENKIHFQSIMMTLTAFVSIILSLILIPKLGAVGAALSISVANIFFMVIGMNLIYWKELNFNILNYLKLILKFISIFIGVGILVKLIQWHIFDGMLHFSNNWINFFIIASIYTLFFFTATYLTLLNNFEKTVVNNIYYKVKGLMIKSHNEVN